MRTDFQHFYVLPDNVDRDFFMLTGDEFHHAVHVLRKTVGESLTAVDGKGVLYTGILDHIEGEQAFVQIQDRSLRVGEPQLYIILAQALLKSNAFDFIIEKGIEIGISSFQPIYTQRTLVKSETRLERWRKKAIAAMKQSGRCVCPEVRKPVLFEKVFEQIHHDLAVFVHEDTPAGEFNSVERIKESKNIMVLVGPEGGFTENEVKFAGERKSVLMSLGPRRLRSETASLVACTKILQWADELG